MKKYIYFICFSVIIAGMAIIGGCTENGDETIIVPKIIIDIENPKLVQNSLSFNDGKLTSGNLPAPTSSNNYLSTSISSITVNSGGTIILPIIYELSNLVEFVYIQVIGADGQFYTVKPTLVQSTDGFGYISIKIPDNLSNGHFSIRYNIKDKSGIISNIVNTIVEVTDVVASCENNKKSGSSGLTFTTLYIGNSSGKVAIEYNTYTVPDRIDIYQGEKWITGTGTNPNSPIPPMCNCSNPLPGFIGKRGVLQFNYDPKNGKNITIVVSGCLNSGTSWDWVLTESPSCN